MRTASRVAIVHCFKIKQSLSNNTFILVGIVSATKS